MDKWMMGAILYVAVMIGGFTLYEDWSAAQEPQQAVAAGAHGAEAAHRNAGVPGTTEAHTSADAQEPADTAHGHAAESNGDHQEAAAAGHSHAEGNGHAQPHDAAHAGTSEVNAYVQADASDIQIFLKDKAGNPVHELEVNHEKILHLIIVDERLQQYVHLHPEQTGEGEFRIANPLPDGLYKAFVDIKPKNLAYHVTPIPFVVGHPQASHTHNEGLKPDQTLERTMDGETVKLQLSSTTANQPVTLRYELDRSQLTPYLGAMGHVVILDEHGQNFLHVHPAEDDEPVFATQFQEPGIYKIWAEFKQNGKVRAFPFVVEIKGEK